MQITLNTIMMIMVIVCYIQLIPVCCIFYLCTHLLFVIYLIFQFFPCILFSESTSDSKPASVLHRVTVTKQPPGGRLA